MSLEKIKEVKQLSSTNEYIGTPIGCDAENVDLADGSNLEKKLDDIDTNIESVNNEVKEIQDSIQIDGVTITRDDATKVIALAKTLQDKIASVDNKINATNIANNLTTTEANFVLDARQGKSLQDQITTLNNDSMRLLVKRYNADSNSTELAIKNFILSNCPDNGMSFCEVYDDSINFFGEAGNWAIIMLSFDAMSKVAICINHWTGMVKKISIDNRDNWTFC